MGEARRPTQQKFLLFFAIHGSSWEITLPRVLWVDHRSEKSVQFSNDLLPLHSHWLMRCTMWARESFCVLAMAASAFCAGLNKGGASCRSPLDCNLNGLCVCVSVALGERCVHAHHKIDMQSPMFEYVRCHSLAHCCSATFSDLCARNQSPLVTRVLLSLSSLYHE
jgi:hypothetical protein